MLVSAVHCCNVRVGGRGGADRDGRKPWNLESDTRVFTLRSVSDNMTQPPQNNAAPQTPEASQEDVAQETSHAEPYPQSHGVCGVFGGAALTYLGDKRGFRGTRLSDPSNLVEGNRHARECTSRKKKNTHTQKPACIAEGSPLDPGRCNKAPSGAVSPSFWWER